MSKAKSRVSETDAGTLELAALGRHGYLGSLYNACEDRFCDGQSLFAEDIPTEMVRVQDIDLSNVEYFRSTDITERFKQLDVSGELKLGILCGLLKLSGAGKFLKETRASEKMVGYGLVCHIETKTQEFQISNKNLYKFIDQQNICEDATHVVQRITWGANAIFSFESTCANTRETKVIKNKLKVKVQSMVKSVEAENGNGRNKFSSKEDFNFTVKYFADVLPKEPLPENEEGVVKFLSELPQLVKSCNNGLGKPLMFSLVPLSAIYKLLNQNELLPPTIVRLQEELVEEITNNFEQVQIMKQKLHDFCSWLENNEICVSDQLLYETKGKIKQIIRYEIDLKKTFADALVRYRRGELLEVPIFRFDALSKFSNWLTNQKAIKMKVKLYNRVKENCQYMGKEAELELEVIDIEEAFILFISASFIDNNNDKLFERFNLFTKLIKECSESYFFLCDLDLNPRNIEEPVIWRYKNGRLVSLDYEANGNLERVSRQFVKSEVLSVYEKCHNCTELTEPEDAQIITILTAGPTEVKRSTWLTGTINYVSINKSQDGEERKCITPTKFTTVYKEEEVTIIRRRKLSLVK